MITQLLKLDPPYNIICGDNKIAKHEATLIVAEIKYDKEYRHEIIAGKEYYFGGPDMQTYSFPVVEYGDGSPAGDVWNDVEVRECRVIAKAQDDGFTTRITSYWFCDFLRFLHYNKYGSTQTPITFYEQLRSLNVDVNLMGSLGHPKKVEVELEFEDSEFGGAIDSATGSGLFYTAVFGTDEKQKQEKFNEILKWAGQYIRIFNAQTIFTCKNEKYKDLLTEWNKAIAEATQKHNERK